MIITDEITTSRGEPKQYQDYQAGDMLNIKKFNSLPSPVTAQLFGGDEHWIESLCVQTGAMRLDVCGLIDLEDFAMVKTLVDINGVEHNPEEFYVDA